MAEKKERLPSGKFLTRVPPKLHKVLVTEAKREGVSLNLYAATALARTLGQREGYIAALSEVEEYERLFALQQTRMGKATKMWRKAHPGQENVSPDLGKLLEWLMAEAKR